MLAPVYPAVVKDPAKASSTSFDILTWTLVVYKCLIIIIIIPTT